MPENHHYNSGDKTWGWLSGMLTTYTSMLGAFDQHDYTTFLGQVYFVLFLALVVIVMLNLLIAIMSDSYATVKAEVDVIIKKKRMETIVTEEALMRQTRIRDIASVLQALCCCGRSTSVERTLPFLEVLQPEVLAETVVEDRALQCVRDDLKREIGRVESKVDGMVDGMAELKALMTQLVEQRA